MSSRSFYEITMEAAGKLEAVLDSQNNYIRNAEGLVLLRNVQTGNLLYARIIEESQTDCNTVDEIEEIIPHNVAATTVSATAVNPTLDNIDVPARATTNVNETIPELRDDAEAEHCGSWGDTATTVLLDLHQTLPFNKAKFKTKEQRWKLIAEELKNMGFTFSWKQCRSRINTLQAGFKRVQDNKKSKKTGRSRIRLNVSPRVNRMLTEQLLKRPTVALPDVMDNVDIFPGRTINVDLRKEDHVNFKPAEDEQEDDSSYEDDVDPVPPEIRSGRSSGISTGTDTPSTSTSARTTHTTGKKKKPTLVSELQLLRQDRKEYSEKRIEKYVEYIEEVKKTNELLKAHNTLLQSLIDK